MNDTLKKYYIFCPFQETGNSDTYNIAGELEQRAKLKDKLCVTSRIINPQTGQKYFNTLVNTLCETLDADIVLVGKLSKNEDSMSTISVSMNGVTVDNFNYSIEGSPFENISSNGFYLHIDNLKKDYPNDLNIREWDTNALIGRCLLDSDKYVNGLICVFYHNKLPDVSLPVFMLNRLIPRTEAELQRYDMEIDLLQSLEQKEELLNLANNRANSSLNILSKISALLDTYITSPQLYKAFSNREERIKTISLIFDQLQNSKNTGAISVCGYIKELKSYLLSVYMDKTKKISVSFCIDDIYLDIDNTFSIGMIVNEIVTNSLVHAFNARDEGEIAICLYVDDRNNIQLIIIDDGKGLPPDSDLGRPGHLGLKLVKKIVKQLGGSMIIERKHGTMFRFSFNFQNIANPLIL